MHRTTLVAVAVAASLAAVHPARAGFFTHWVPITAPDGAGNMIEIDPTSLERLQPGFRIQARNGNRPLSVYVDCAGHAGIDGNPVPLVPGSALDRIATLWCPGSK